MCIQITNPVTREGQAKSPWIELGAEYEVLELYAYPGGRIDLRLAAGETATPALFDAAMFMTSDGALPANWAARIEDGGLLRIGPKEWMEPGFWDAFFDEDPAAVDVYKRGMRRDLTAQPVSLSLADLIIGAMKGSGSAVNPEPGPSPEARSW